MKLWSNRPVCYLPFGLLMLTTANNTFYYLFWGKNEEDLSCEGRKVPQGPKCQKIKVKKKGRSFLLTGKSFLLTVGLCCLQSIGLVFFTYG